MEEDNILVKLIKPMVNKNFIMFYLVMLVAAVIFMYAFMWFNNYFTKAQQYDFYKDIIISLENCTVKPTCFCFGNVTPYTPIKSFGARP